MARTTKEQLQNKFEQFVKAVGGKVASEYNDEGGYSLDNQPIYGGWVVEQVVNDAGSIHHPFGPARKKAGELWDALDFAIRAIEIKEGSR